MAVLHCNHSLKIGLFGIGLETYWGQFEGLEARLRGYLDIVAGRLGRPGVEVVNLGMIDTPEKALAAGHQFRQADVDLIFLYVTTYALSSTVLPVVRRAKVPVIILNLQPAAAIDYAAFNAMGDRTRMTGEWLAHCAACPVPEIANVFNRTGVPFHQITGMLHDDPACWNEAGEWVEAARVAHAMEHNRMGVMGHYYGGMLDIYSDLTQQCAAFGGHVEIIEVDELAALRAQVSDGEIGERVKLFLEAFEVQEDCPRAELDRAARTSVALDRMAEAHHLGSLAYYYMGSGNPANEDAISSMNCSWSISPVASIWRAFQMIVPDPVRSPWNQPLSIGPPESTMAGMSTVAAAMSCDGVVLSHPVVNTTPSRKYP
jgi:L-arabinose isomerase